MAEAKVPRKYWWVVAVAVPVAVALIAAVPGLFKPSGPGGGTNTTINGNNNTVNFDYSTNNTFVTNVNVIAREVVEGYRAMAADEEREREAFHGAGTEHVQHAGADDRREVAVEHG